VDFWDITKLLVRRWMIVLPMVVLSGALAVVAMSHVKPDYVGTAYVQLVPPVTGATKPGEATADQRNPWIGLGLQTIGNAAIVTLTDVSVAEELHAKGYSGAYTVTMAQSSPLITFEIVGDSPDQAKRTAEQLISRFDNSVASLQTSYGVSKADSISSHRLDEGTNVKKSTSKVKRALVAVAGAGLLLTIAVTVGVDAWLRRRQRRLAGTEPVAAASPRRTSTVGAHSNGQRGPEPYLVTMTGALNGSANRGAATGVGAAAGRDGVTAGSSSDLTQPIGRSGSAQPVDEERAPAIPSDATIVLPRVRPQPVARPGQESK
jgi:capsular polysaccharide biosynthesis protein